MFALPCQEVPRCSTPFIAVFEYESAVRQIVDLLVDRYGVLISGTVIGNNYLVHQTMLGVTKLLYCFNFIDAYLVVNGN